jgi:hypothetical protein
MSMSSVATAVAEATLSQTAYFSVHARAEPGVMPRVLELFAKRGLVPSVWHSALSVSDRAVSDRAVSDRAGADRAGAGADRLTIEIQMCGLGGDATDYIAACLRQITSVEAVVTCCRDGGGD